MGFSKMDTNRLLEIAKEFRTPVYVYDENQVRKNYRVFFSAFRERYKKSRILYAYKANSNLAICSILREEGAGADIVSCGELQAALRVGVHPENILFTNNSKSEEEIQMALDAGIILNVDSMDELKTLEKISSRSRKTARISFRINPSIDPKTHPKIATGMKESKFGIHIHGNALKAYKLAEGMKNIEIVGIHMHIGSQIMDLSVFQNAAEKIMEFIAVLNKKLNIQLEFVDLGGGLGVPYHGEEALHPEDLARGIVPIVKKFVSEINYEPELWLEPGRYLVGNSGVLLCSVQSVKRTPYKNFINVDCGFNTLLRPAMYDAYHRVQVLNKLDRIPTETYDIAGNVCESGDILAKNRRLPRVEPKDIIAILDTGAYGFSMSSQYNSRPRPAEVLFWEDSVELIRERETEKDLFLHQRIPGDLMG